MCKCRFLLILIAIFRVFGFAGVDERTGQMSCIDRLATIEGDSLLFNLDLQYSAGIKINQRASWVGLGFELSLPYIERVPNGSVDEKSGEFKCNGPDFYSEKNYNKLISETSNGYSENTAQGDFTGQQDNYFLNADFAAGRIVFAQPTASEPDAPLKAFLQNWRAIKIEYKIDDEEDDDDENDDIYQWEITDENGIVYIFGQPVRAATELLDPSMNTSKTLSGTGGVWQTTTCYPTGGDPYPCQVIQQDHYVNESYNRRWYLTEMRSPNYTLGNGEKITITYTSPSATGVYIRDLFHYAEDDLDVHKAVTEVFKYEEEIGEEVVTQASLTYGYDNYYLYPVYPVVISSSSMQAQFIMSTTVNNEILIQGNKRIERIELYSNNGSNYTLKSNLQFHYDESGLAANHPYSSSGKGRLCLNEITTASSDGTAFLPLISFEYTSNPSFAGINGYYRHDLYGFYSNTELVRESGTFNYPQGQSTVGNNSTPGAEAWSVNKIIYGNGQVEEYEYEPNEVTKLTTDEIVVTENAPVLNPGFRVKMRKVYNGVSATPVITNYEYENGFMSHSYALLPDVESMYALLNDEFEDEDEDGVDDHHEEFDEIMNVMFLHSSSVQYGTCTKSITNSGTVKTWFLNPSSAIPIYGSSPPVDYLLKDRYVTGTNGLNSRAHYQGIPWKTESFREGTNSNPVHSMVTQFAINYDLYSYTIPQFITYAAIKCATGTDPADPSEILDQEDNLNQTYDIGFIRPMGTIETKNGITSRNDIVSYNEANGLPATTRIVNSGGDQKLTRVIFAIEEKNTDNSLVYQDMKEAHILSPVSETVTYEKPNGSTNTDVLPTDVRTAKAVTYSNTLGSAAWVPYKSYTWEADLQADGTPDETFSDFDHSSGASNPNWEYTGSVEKYSEKSLPLQTKAPNTLGGFRYSSNIYGYNGILPLATVTKAQFRECGVFTGDYQCSTNPTAWWDYENGWEKGQSNPPTLSTSTRHFGQMSIHVEDDYAAGRNCRIYPGKSYTFSAWVKPVSGTITIDADFRYLIADEGKWPLEWATDLVSVDIDVEEETVTSDGSGKWQLMTMVIPAAVTAQLDAIDASKKWYTRIWIGGNPGSSSFEAYIDDVRFGPTDAMTTSTFYDQKWLKPLVSVDASNLPGRRVTYDDFGRPIQWDKIDPAKGVGDAGYATSVQEKTYHVRNELPGGATVQVLSPDGREDYDGADNITIRWVNAGTQSINLYYKEQNADDTWPTTWEEITTSPLSGQTGWCSYNWDVPSTITNDCLIKVEIDGSGENDESDRPFTLN